MTPHNIAYYTTAILVSWIVLMVTLERFYPYRKGLLFFRDGFFIDFVWYTVIQSYFLKIVIFDYIIAPLKVYFNFSDSGYLSHWPIWLLVVLFLVTHDFYIYWFHRLQHTSKFFWRTHEAHHSVTEVDWLAGSRSHVLEILINQTIEFLPIFFLLDLQTAMIIVPIKALLDATWGMYIHSNIDVHSGKLQYFINGPEMHQWHHADHKEVFYSNYGTKFSIWDWLFGTGFLPGLQPLQHGHSKPLKYGLPYHYPKDYFMQHWFAIKRFNVPKVENWDLVKRYNNIRVESMLRFEALFKPDKSDSNSNNSSDSHPSDPTAI